jgi:hypothetical protein
MLMSRASLCRGVLIKAQTEEESFKSSCLVWWTTLRPVLRSLPDDELAWSCDLGSLKNTVAMHELE